MIWGRAIEPSDNQQSLRFIGIQSYPGFLGLLLQIFGAPSRSDLDALDLNKDIFMS
jgi:hypothetical protein